MTPAPDDLDAVCERVTTLADWFGAEQAGADLRSMLAHVARLREDEKRLDWLAELLRDARRWRAAVAVWKRKKLRPPQVGLDDGNDCFDTFDEAADAARSVPAPTQERTDGK